MPHQFTDSPSVPITCDRCNSLAPKGGWHVIGYSNPLVRAALVCRACRDAMDERDDEPFATPVELGRQDLLPWE